MANFQKLIDLDGLSYFLEQIKTKFIRSVNGAKPDSKGNVNIANMEGATSDAAGKAGLVPIPATGKQDMALCGDATFKVLPIAGGGTGQTTVAGVRNILGLGNTDGALPIANGGTGATNAEQALKNLGGIKSVNGVVAGDDGDVVIIIPNMSGATTNAMGKAGLVPAPAAGAQAKFLRGDGEWAPPDTAFVPDYSSGVDLAANVDNTIASNGFVWARASNYGNGSQSLYVTINGVQFDIITNDYSSDSIFFPVLANDVVHWRNTNCSVNVKFYKAR